MHALPDALLSMAAYRQFILYKLVPSQTKPGKNDKFPCDFRNGRVASAHDAAIWTEAQTAIAAAAQYGSNYGVGFTFTEHDPFFFLDIDGALDASGQWSPLAQHLCAAFQGAAMEVSSSGRGLHIFGSGRPPAHSCKNTALNLELYHTGRFVALTGLNAIGNAAIDCSAVLPWLVANYFPPDSSDGTGDDWTTGPCSEWRGPSDDTQLLARAMRSQSVKSAFGGGAAFSDLWNCNVEVLARSYPPNGEGNTTPYDASSVDAALAQHLAFWTGKDCERIKRMMLLSSLRRAKWEREDYLPRTITSACARQIDVLTDKEPEPIAGLPSLNVTGNGPSVQIEYPKPSVVAGTTFLSPEQQQDQFAGCVYIIEHHKVLIPGGVLVKEGQFKVLYGGHTMPLDYANERSTRDAWEAFTQSQAIRAPRADKVCFRPDLPPAALVKTDGQTLANIYWPIEVPRKVGDPSPFINHLKKLLPDERDRAILMAYMAAIVQHKGIKFQWAPLLQGVEGNGKTILTYFVAAAVGSRYSYFPSAQDLADKFNDWMLGHIFIGVQDVYVPGDRGEILEALKPMISDREQQIQGKGKDKTKGDVCCNWMLNSNHRSGIPVSDKSRRYAYFYTAQQELEDLERDGMTGDYFPNLWDWARNGGTAIVAELLHTWPIPDEYNPATKCPRAPQTSSTAQAVAESRGGVEQEIIEAVEQGLQGFAGGWISSLALDKLLEKIGAARRIPHMKRRELLKTLGYVPHPMLPDGRVTSVILPDAGKPRLYVKRGSAAMLLPSVADVLRAYSAAQNVIDVPVIMS